MSGHGPIFDWQDFDSNKLQEAIALIDRLGDLGIQCCSEDMRYSMQEELKARKAKTPEKTKEYFVWTSYSVEAANREQAADEFKQAVQENLTDLVIEEN